jgi:UDP-N-acetylmuramate dehydrogenase
MLIESKIPLAPLTTLGIGGVADYFARVTSEAELREALGFAREQQLPVYLLGGGSNVYFADSGYRGLVLKNEMRSIDWLENCQARVEAGAPLGLLVRQAAEHGCSGLTWATGLPGTVGGALVGNAGAYGTELGSLLTSAEVLELATLESRTVTPDFFQFAYRSSALKGKQTHILLSAVLQLSAGDSMALTAELAEVAKARAAKQPRGRTAGSFFKNPAGGHKAWQLIDSAGMRDARVGDAAVSTEHANYLINLGAATAQDLETLARQIEKAVYTKHGVTLEREVLGVPEC